MVTDILGLLVIGKTIFVGEHSHQWVDADEIFPALGIHTEYWHSVEHSEQEQREHYVACDHALGEMRDTTPLSKCGTLGCGS